MSEFLENGMVSVNTGLFTDAALPFGGVKESGFAEKVHFMEWMTIPLLNQLL